MPNGILLMHENEYDVGSRISGNKLTQWPLGDVVVILKINPQNNILGTRFEIALMRMPQNFINEKSILVQVKA